MKLKQYILITLLCLLALLGLVWQFAEIPFFPSRSEVMFRQQIMLERWVDLVNRKHNIALPTDEEPEAVFLPEEAYQRSIELLSAGRQIEADEVISKSLQNNFDDTNLLFAKAVLERSRWNNYVAELWSKVTRREGARTYLGEAASLELRLDGRKARESDLTDLILLSDNHPDDVYLLWLSAIQCREQKMGELGRRQYEKLLSKFRVGPVMAHHTYANILTEYLQEYDKALEHRYLAVALEAKGWTLQGLANTLRKKGDFEKSSAIWARAVQMASDESDYWSGWGDTLYWMKQYGEAAAKYREAVRLTAGDKYSWYWLGRCLENLNQYDEMAAAFRRAAVLGDTVAQAKLGALYEAGRGVTKDSREAVKWYQLAAGRKNSEALHNLALCYHMGKGVTKDLAKAVSLYKESVEMSPADAYALNGYAWFLATSEDVAMRDYPEAVRLAERSVAVEEKFFNLDTLAVAYAANGQYDKAVETQQRMMDFWTGNHAGKPAPEYMTKRLAEFEQQAAEHGL